MNKLLLYILLSAASFEVNGQVIRIPIPDKLVVLTFDDAPVTHFTFVAPLLKKYGFGATFFVCEFPPNYADTTRYMTWKQIQALSRMGFDIGNHTRDHKHVNKLSKQQLNEELAYIEAKCDSLKISKPVTFAYPGYDTHPLAIETLQERGYDFARTGGDRPYNPLTDHPYLVPGYTTTKTNSKQIFDAFADARQGQIVVLTIHGVPDYEHDWVTTPPELLVQYLEYLHKNHYKVISMRGLLKYIDPAQARKDIKPLFTKKELQ